MSVKRYDRACGIDRGNPADEQCVEIERKDGRYVLASAHEELAHWYKQEQERGVRNRREARIKLHRLKEERDLLLAVVAEADANKAILARAGALILTPRLDALKDSKGEGFQWISTLESNKEDSDA